MAYLLPENTHVGDRNHYIYRHIRHDRNEPFYIGLGTLGPDDVGHYRATTTKSRSILWDRIIKKTAYTIEIVIDNLTLAEAKQKEIELIKLYGRRDLGAGPLVNLTDGGEGVKRLKHSEEQRKSNGDRKRGVRLSDAHKGAISRALIGRQYSAESLQRMSNAAKGNRKGAGHKVTDGHRAILRKLHTGTKHTDDVKRRLSEAKTGKRLPGLGLCSVFEYQSGAFIGAYGNVKEAAETLGCIYQNANKVVNGQRSHANGYVFKRVA